jgi:hypothetical protein
MLEYIGEHLKKNKKIHWRAALMTISRPTWDNSFLGFASILRDLISSKAAFFLLPIIGG